MTTLNWEFYRQMFTIRLVEELFLSLFSTGSLYGTVHTCIGQEACSVGVVNALDKTKDIIWSNHRGHGHYLAYCDDVDGIIAEVMGKKTGVCGGVGGSQHIHKDNFYTNGVLGGTVPCAVGSALAEKSKGSGAIVTSFLGDGALGEGVVYESLNIASLWKLPILFVLEHNGYAQSTPTFQEHAGSLKQRALAFNISCDEINADDVAGVYQMAKTTVDNIRREQQPSFLILHTYRLAPHSKGDDFRPQEEIDHYKENDPLFILRNQLDNENPDWLEQLEENVKKRVSEGVKKAELSGYQDVNKIIREATIW